MSHRARHDFLPTSLHEAAELGWNALDVVLVSADAYVDHPSFAVAILGRVLQAAGYRVGVISQPNWKDIDDFRSLGRPELFFGVSGGNVDSMLANYTPRRRRRNDDPYSPGGVAGRRPDRATAVYAHKCREAYPGTPIIIGGIEASLRRLAHWDHWSESIRPSMLISSKADLLAYGMGERLIREIADHLACGGSTRDLKEHPSLCSTVTRDALPPEGQYVELPSFEKCRENPALIADVTRAVVRTPSPSLPLVQPHGDLFVLHQPPAPPPTGVELDTWFALPFTREAHPALEGPVPALETVRWSVVTHRGCFGGCSFCSLAEHQGRAVVSRSLESIVDEVSKLTKHESFHGTLDDLGGPSANMYGLGCRRPDGGASCRRRSCLHPKKCKNLETDSSRWRELLRRCRELDGIRQIRVASGVRMDLLLEDRQALRELVRHHVGGQLKVAPEHDAAAPLEAMRKYPPGTLARFKRAFDAECRSQGLDQYLVAYLMSGHPGTSLQDMIALSRQLEELGMRPRQVQDFTPTPMTLSTAQHLAGCDPLTGRSTPPVHSNRARDDQRALLQWFLPQYRKRADALLRKMGERGIERGRKKGPKRSARRRRRRG